MCVCDSLKNAFSPSFWCILIVKKSTKYKWLPCGCKTHYLHSSKLVSGSVYLYCMSPFIWVIRTCVTSNHASDMWESCFWCVGVAMVSTCGSSPCFKWAYSALCNWMEPMCASSFYELYLKSFSLLLHSCPNAPRMM